MHLKLDKIQRKLIELETPASNIRVEWTMRWLQWSRVPISQQSRRPALESSRKIAVLSRHHGQWYKSTGWSIWPTSTSEICIVLEHTRSRSVREDTACQSCNASTTYSVEYIETSSWSSWSEEPSVEDILIWRRWRTKCRTASTWSEFFGVLYNSQSEDIRVLRLNCLRDYDCDPRTPA